MAERSRFMGISQLENLQWEATLGDWSELFDTEWEAIIGRDMEMLRAEGETADTTLDRPSVKDIIMRGGWDYVMSSKGVARCQDLVNRARLRLDGPLPQIAPTRRGKPMRQAHSMSRRSKYRGVYQADDRWQAKVGKRYISSSGNEKVAALMRDIGVLQHALEELNYPREFVEQAFNYGAKALQKPEILALFINRLDEELAKADAQRHGEKNREAQPQAHVQGGTLLDTAPATQQTAAVEDEADDFFAGPDPATGEPGAGPIPSDRIQRGLDVARAVQREEAEAIDTLAGADPATGELTEPVPDAGPHEPVVEPGDGAETETEMDAEESL